MEQKLKKDYFSLSLDKWLSKIIGKNVYCFNVINNNFKIKTLKNFIQVKKKLIPKENFIIYIKVETYKKNISNKLLRCNFKLINQEYLFVKNKESLKHKINSKIRRYKPTDLNILKRIAEKSFNFSRFHQDQKIPKTTANFIKKKWLENFFLGLRGDDLIVSISNGRPVGFLLLLKKQSNIIIDLIAVDKNHQGQGYANHMINYLEKNYRFDKIFVGTQSNNISSISLYKKLNYKIIKTNNIFHFHN